MNNKIILWAVMGIILISGANASLTDGLMPFMTLDDSKISGSMALSSTGLYNMTNNGATTGRTGKLAESYYFVTNDYLNNTGISAIGLNVTGGITMCAWINATANDEGAFERIIKTDQVTGQYGYGMQFRGTIADALAIWTVSASGECMAYNATAYADTASFRGNWYYICGIFNTTGNYLFVNGMQRAFNTYTSGGCGATAGVQTRLYIGEDQEGTGEAFDGELDEIGIWNRSLSPAEITTLYNNGTGLEYPFVETPSITQDYVLTIPEESQTTINITFQNYNLTNETTAFLTYNNTVYNGTIDFQNESYVKFIATPTSPFAYLNTTQINMSWNYTLKYSNGSNYSSNASQITQGIYWNLTKYPRVKINATDLIGGGAITTFSITDGSKTINTTNGNIYLWETANGTYEITINNPNYELKTSNITFITGTYGNYTFQLYTTNSIQIYIRDEDTNAIITDNISIYFITNLSQFTNYTTSGSIYLDGLYPGEYNINFENLNTTAGYNSRTYILTLNNRSFQTLTAYLNKNTSSTTFTVTDKDTGQYLENVLVTMYRYINGTWSAIESKYTDITGKTLLAYQTGTQYKFFLGKTDYEDYVFYLNPVLYSDYSIQMQKSVVYDKIPDYNQIAIIYSPHIFTNGSNTFNWIIQSPYGELTDYGFTITYKTETATQTGNNAIGGQLSDSINISNPAIWDYVTLYYYYNTSLSGQRTFTINLPINSYEIGNNTFISNRDNTYGLGIFERVLVTSLILIFIVGISALAGNILAGLGLSLIVNGLMIYMGFAPFWAFGISMVLTVFFLTWEA